MELKRSWMFVPGHRQKMIDKALGLDADAIMLDIEDGVAPNEKDTARQLIAEALGHEKAPHSPARFVRITPSATRAWTPIWRLWSGPDWKDWFVPK
jgi:citrate lyase beta subunit